MFSKGITVMVTGAWYAVRAFYKGGVGSEKEFQDVFASSRFPYSLVKVEVFSQV